MEINSVYLGDNIELLKKIPNDFIDLCYIDPPFYTGRDWHDYQDKWESIDEYITFMILRVIEIFRVLKNSGSLIVHADYHAVHHLKVSIDNIFNEENFRGEFYWIKKKGHQSFKGIDTRVDTILYYAKSKDHETIPQFIPVDDAHLKEMFPNIEPVTKRRFSIQPLERKSNEKDSNLKTRRINGIIYTASLGWVWSQKHLDEYLAKNPRGIYWRGRGRPYYKIYADTFKGMRLTNAWTDIDELQNVDSERVDYKTQKPEALLSRIIDITTKPGDLVLDAFCGSGTTLVAAKRKDRKYIGIDINPNAVEISKKRLKALIKYQKVI